MKRIAITGGIGSGKSFVCRLLAQRGIQVYDCDAAAKRLMRTDAVLQRQLRELVGDDVYQGHDLQKRVLASFCWPLMRTSRRSTILCIRQWHRTSSRAAVHGWRVLSFSTVVLTVVWLSMHSSLSTHLWR